MYIGFFSWIQLELLTRTRFPFGSYLSDGDVEAGGDVVDRFAALGDDADRLGDGLGRHWMVTRHHDDLRSFIRFHTIPIQALNTGNDGFPIFVLL